MQRIDKIVTGLLGGLVTLLLIGQAIAGVAAPPPSCVEPPDDLVSWYPAEGNAFDIQSANDGTLQNGATVAAGKVGQAFSLDGVNDFVTIPDSASLDVTQITVDAWIYLVGAGDVTDHQGIYAKSDNTGDSYSLFIRDSTLGLYNSLTFNGFSQVFETGGGVIQPGVWQHVAQTYDGTTLKNYVNGQLIQSWTVSGSITPNNGPLTISSRNGQHPFQGLIDEMEIFNRALTAAEIAAIVDAGKAGKCYCGNGSVDLSISEQCEDGNLLNGDCCSATCQFESIDTVCGDTDIACVKPDTCDGAGACIDNGFAALGTACGDESTTACDNPDTCDEAGGCQQNFEPNTTVCRTATEACDVAESCTGSSATCPDDSFASSSTVCRSSAGVCDLTESCTGSAPTCPGDAKSADVCRTSAGICDVVESCNGVGNDCPANGFASRTTTCRSPEGECDLAENCSGSSAACPNDAKKANNTACTADSNLCTQDICNGSSVDCTHPPVQHTNGCVVNGQFNKPCIGTSPLLNVILGTNNPDVIVGTQGGDTISGGGGNDLVCGGAGNDILIGNAGNDQLLGEGGNDALWGELGNDILDGGPGSDTLNGGVGSDQCANGELNLLCNP